ncbi:LytR/AlgR family response regulator transcription factor [Spongiivirga citrea]|uniref:Response regulator n=1 Tax=Spongiivirga citrea TaxID=1481457 RepID=A0A6M0CH58_9FLAO|nr:LytTR family DNA-binding domain-containing protein [Spongiivirga citrea]NER17266.1 response regulator [Spongiivirga citrea]
MTRAIIIDDEEGAREGLSLLMQKYCADVEILALCNGGKQGIEAIHTYKPELVFLDVQMPGMSGFQMLETLGNIDFEIIFVTAYDKYAIKAIKFSALDYLLKPVDIDDLIKSVQKVQQKQFQKQQAGFQSLLNNMSQIQDELTRLAIPSDNEIIMQEVKDIVYCEADSSYTTIHIANDKKLTVSKTLKEFEIILPETKFCRIHHGTLVNIEHVSKYIKGEGGYVIVSNGQHLNVSRRKKESFIQMLSKV